MQNIPAQSPKFNDDYDVAAEHGLRKLNNDRYYEAIETIAKLSPTAIRYLQSIQEFNWLDDAEMAGKCASRFIDVAREIAKQCNVVISHGERANGSK